jgi:hypothetical protein
MRHYGVNKRLKMGRASPVKAAMASTEANASRNSFDGITLELALRNGPAWLCIA